MSLVQLLCSPSEDRCVNDVNEMIIKDTAIDLKADKGD